MSLLCQLQMTHCPVDFQGVFGVTVRLMSDRELQRLEMLQDLDRRRLTPAAAGQLLGLERRQVFRLLKAYRIEGPIGLTSKRRGRRSNRRKPEAVRHAVLMIIRQFTGILARRWRPRSCARIMGLQLVVKRCASG